jgi:hypothetical protein
VNLVATQLASFVIQALNSKTTHASNAPPTVHYVSIQPVFIVNPAIYTIKPAYLPVPKATNPNQIPVNPAHLTVKPVQKGFAKSV